MTERLMLPEQSGCKVCRRCTWTKGSFGFRCPYGGPFSGYQFSNGQKFALGDTIYFALHDNIYVAHD